jgi:hypothetical protein
VYITGLFCTEKDSRPHDKRPCRTTGNFIRCVWNFLRLWAHPSPAICGRFYGSAPWSLRSGSTCRGCAICRRALSDTATLNSWTAGSVRHPLLVPLHRQLGHNPLVRAAPPLALFRLYVTMALKCTRCETCSFMLSAVAARGNLHGRAAVTQQWWWWECW